MVLVTASFDDTRTHTRLGGQRYEYPGAKLPQYVGGSCPPQQIVRGLQT